jgi:Pretoxin HINT domain/A nuclease family of the HNH/ENDO VII superfamily with conserved AHH
MTVQFADGREVGTTGEHPFYVVGQGWVEACRLQPGDRVATSESGQSAVVKEIRDDNRLSTVYNCEVEEHHTYFVGDITDNPLWVHNRDYTGQLALTGKEPYTVLRTALGITSNPVSPSAAHHIIPWSLRNLAGAVGDRIRAAARGGFNINGKANGLALPHPHTHPSNIFNHPMYNSRVAKLINNLPDGLTDAQYANALHHIADRLGIALQRIADKHGGVLHLR